MIYFSIIVWKGWGVSVFLSNIAGGYVSELIAGRHGAVAVIEDPTLSIYLSNYLSIYQSIYLSIYLSVYLVAGGYVSELVAGRHGAMAVVKDHPHPHPRNVLTKYL